MEETNIHAVKTLVDALIVRNDLAWQGFLHEIYPIVVGICRQAGLSDDEIDDIAQSVTIKMLDKDCRILRNLKIEGKRQFYAWVKIVISRTVIDYIRSVNIKKEKESEFIKDITYGSQKGDDPVHSVEARAVLEKAARGLSGSDQIFFWMAYEDVPVEEIARVTGLSIPAAQQRLSRMRKRLRHVFENVSGISNAQ